MPRETVLSRHRLPQPYRAALIICWLLPAPLLLLAIVAGRGMTPALFDPRFLILVGLMSLPACYVWQEGVDVLPSGIIARLHWPRYHAYQTLAGWDERHDRACRILIIWGKAGERVLEIHAAHLTDFSVLFNALGENVERIADLEQAQFSD